MKIGSKRSLFFSTHPGKPALHLLPLPPDIESSPAKILGTAQIVPGQFLGPLNAKGRRVCSHL